jgi:hypothetical protein
MCRAIEPITRVSDQGVVTVRAVIIASILLATIASGVASATEPTVVFSGAHKQNNLVTELLEVASISEPGRTFTFVRPDDGWVFLTAERQGKGKVRIVLDERPIDAVGDRPIDAARHVAKGEHRIRVDCSGGCRVDRLVVKAIPELMHCGLGFDPEIKSYGRYDMAFLKKDILPNVTTLIVPSSIKLAPSVIDDWHHQGKRFVAEVGINGQATTADEHSRFWAGFFDRSPFLDGIIVNEFIVNNPSTRPGEQLSPERAERMNQERQRYRVYGEAIKKLRADDRYRGKMLYGYIGGSGKKLNQEVIGPDFIRTIIDCGYRVALERYIFEVSSPKKSDDVLELFVDGIADWEAKEPGVRKHMVITFGLFSIPPGASTSSQTSTSTSGWTGR